MNEYQKACAFFKSKKIIIKERGKAIVLDGLFLFLPIANRYLCFKTRQWYSSSGPEDFYATCYDKSKETATAEKITTNITKKEIEEFEYIFDK